MSHVSAVLPSVAGPTTYLGMGFNQSAQQQPMQAQPPSEGDSIQVGFYRDGANDLDAPDGIVDEQARSTSRLDPRVHLTIEDTTRLLGDGLHTYTWDADHGVVSHFQMDYPRDMSGRAEMANFVARTLDQAYRYHRPHVWLFLVDHGAGDAGGLFTQEPDGSLQHMSLDTLRGGISDGIAIHKRHYPKDKNGHIEGVVMHECFEGTVSVAETLASVGVQYLYASSETTIAPGIPAEVLHDIAAHVHNPTAQAKAVVDRVMNMTYVQTDGHGHSLEYHPAATFMALDLAPNKMAALEAHQQRLNRLIIYYSSISPKFRRNILSDLNAVQGMERDQKATPGKPAERVPWTSDRSMMEVCAKFALDTRLPKNVRHAAMGLFLAIASILIYHRESLNSKGFDADYRDAIGPTGHYPTDIPDINPDAPSIRETDSVESDMNLQNAMISALLFPGSQGVQVIA